MPDGDPRGPAPCGKGRSCPTKVPDGSGPASHQSRGYSDDSNHRQRGAAVAAASPAALQSDTTSIQ